MFLCRSSHLLQKEAMYVILVFLFYKSDLLGAFVCSFVCLIACILEREGKRGAME